jgi:hypothetical protein
MHYWWVNQDQTFRQETEGGYLWSPKRNANGARNPTGKGLSLIGDDNRVAQPMLGCRD